MSTQVLVVIVAVVAIIAFLAARTGGGPRVTQIDRTVTRKKEDEE
jgi:hypothetical protein